MMNNQRRSTSLCLCEGFFAYAVRFFAYRYFYFYFMKMKFNAQRTSAAGLQ